MPATPLTLYSTKGSGLTNAEIDGNFSALANQIDSRAGTAGGTGSRNKLLNGKFGVNQRSVSGAVNLAAGSYGHDRWKAGAGGCTYTFAVSGNETIITITAGSLMQVIEGVNISGGIHALSHTGTAQARIAINGAATSGAYVAATKNAPLLSASATGGQNVTVEFSTGTVSSAQFEPGSIATTFEDIEPGEMIRRCRRYYMRWTGGGSQQIPAVAGVANSVYVPLPLTTPLRTTPTMLTSGVVAANYSGASTPNANQWTFGLTGVVYASVSSGAMSVGLIAQTEQCGFAASGMGLSNIPNFAQLGANMWIDASAEL